MEFCKVVQVVCRSRLCRRANGHIMSIEHVRRGIGGGCLVGIVAGWSPVVRSDLFRLFRVKPRWA